MAEIGSVLREVIKEAVCGIYSLKEARSALLALGNAVAASPLFIISRI